jgi:tRNA pseudouridine65 synthase
MFARRSSDATVSSTWFTSGTGTSRAFASALASRRTSASVTCRSRKPRNTSREWRASWNFGQIGTGRENAPQMTPDDTRPLRILHADAAIVAIDKPAGLLVHRSSLDAHERRSAVELLRTQLGAPVWLLHRLDKATSGVLAFARGAAAASVLGQAFEAGHVRKRYLALVRGWPDIEGEIDYPLARDPELPSAGQPRLPAVTRWRRLAAFEWAFPDGRHASSRYALVEVEPLSGRRHQIRRHFKHLAHPLVGDTTHGKGAHNRAVAAWLGTTRLWLHATRLELPGSEGAPAVVVTSEPGGEWAPLLRELG